MKIILTLLFITMVMINVFAQKTWNFEDKTFNYLVAVDSFSYDSGDYWGRYNNAIKSVTIFRKADNKLFQTIIPPYNRFDSYDTLIPKFIIDDLNFDGINDFLVIWLYPNAPPAVPYYFWIFDQENQQFQRDTIVEILNSPIIDHKRKKISTSFFACCAVYEESIYKVKKGKITQIELMHSHDCIGCNPPVTVIKWYKLKHGEMKLVRKKEVRINL